MFSKCRLSGTTLSRIFTRMFPALLCFLMGAAISRGQQRQIPTGTILPVRLSTTISFDKCTARQLIYGKIAQDVPLPDGSKIRSGSKVEGHIVQVTPATANSGAMISIRFDKIYSQGQTIPVTTDLRAMAGSMAILEAKVPEEAPTEGSPYVWLPTTQIGGDSIYGLRGPVMSAEDTSEVIGKSVPNGVLDQVSAKEDSHCRGEIEGNNHPQALWVFSADACGIYGMEHLRLSHAGRTDPVGTFTLASDTQNFKIPDATGMLLRVEGTSHN